MGDIDGHVDKVVVHAGRTNRLSVARKAMPNLAEAGQLFHIGMDQLATHLVFVVLDLRFRLQVA